jgi:predicted metal-dependent phosphoesterase TrpH
MFSVDLHAHTRFFHGFQGRPTAFDPIGAQLLALTSRRAQLDGVALTNHDYHAEFDPILHRTQFIPGIEISTTMGHVVIVGPDPPSRTIPGKRTPEEVVSLAHDRGCAAIIAHPFRRSRVRESGAEFDAVELNGKHPEDIDRVRAFAATLEVPIVGGSDAHFPFEVGNAFTKVEIPQLTTEAVVTAILEGQVEPHIREGTADGAMRTAYRYVHRYRRR